MNNGAYTNLNDENNRHANYHVPVVAERADAQPVAAQPVAQPTSYQGGEVYAIPQQQGYAGAGQGMIPGGLWPTHLFACFDNVLPSCLMSCCCWCFPLARVRASQNIQSTIGSNYSTNLAIFIFIYLVLSFASGMRKTLPWLQYVQIVVGVFFVYVVVSTRMEYRQKRGITENCCPCQTTVWDDCFSSWCCTCCAIAQMDRTEFNWNDSGDCGAAFSDPGNNAANNV